LEMKLSNEHIRGLGLALNEATLLGIEANPEKRRVGATFDVLTLPEDGSSPQDTRIQFIFDSVGRIAASLRLGRWNDLTAKVESFGIEQLLQVAQNFRCPIYGREFFNLDDQKLDWLGRLSLDWRSDDGGSNSFNFFQDGGTRHLDICVWFDRVTIRDSKGEEITLDNFIAGGKGGGMPSMRVIRELKAAEFSR
jgi:hypothetical protein